MAVDYPDTGREKLDLFQHGIVTADSLVTVFHPAVSTPVCVVYPAKPFLLRDFLSPFSKAELVFFTAELVGDDPTG